ncbi:MAG: hypothetical protein IJ011_05605 [Clostridia bacterium]|nr:hypothetical protein [Clostridia bacterium]
MRSEFFILFIVLFIVIFIKKSNERATVRRIINAKRRSKGEKTQMTELAKRFIDKECIIYTLNSQLDGVTVKEVSDGAVLVEKNGTLEAVNLDFITRIREYPRGKNGKKKSIVLD